MLICARALNFIPRIRIEKINGEHWRTSYSFSSYKEAHTKALQDIKRGNNLRKVDSDATHDFLQHIQNKRGVWDKKKVKPHRTTQGKWPETMRSGWQMATAEWMADDRGIRQAEGTVQQMATEDTRGQQHMSTHTHTHTHTHTLSLSLSLSLSLPPSPTETHTKTKGVPGTKRR